MEIRSTLETIQFGSTITGACGAIGINCSLVALVMNAVRGHFIMLAKLDPANAANMASIDKALVSYANSQKFIYNCMTGFFGMIVISAVTFIWIESIKKLAEEGWERR